MRKGDGIMTELLLVVIVWAFVLAEVNVFFILKNTKKAPRLRAQDTEQNQN